MLVAVGQVGQDVVVIKRFTVVRVESGSGATDQNGVWNEFLLPLIYLQSQEKFTLALGLRMFQGEMSTSWHLLMAASLLTMLPVLILFFAAQKYFMQGIVFTGVKS